MDIVTKFILTIAAAAIALFLFIIGFRKLRLDPLKKYSIFIVTIVLFLHNITCSFGKTNDTSNNIIQKLSIQEDWQDFKKFWKKLDAIEPRKHSIFGDDYKNTISLKEIVAYNREFKNIEKKLIGLLKKNLINEKEKKYLMYLCQKRIENMNSPSLDPHIMTMHAPPDHLMHNDINFTQLEKKIDILIKLNKNKNLNKQELHQAFDNILKEIEICIVDYYTKPDVGYTFVYRRNTKDDLLSQLEKEFDKIKKLLEKNKSYSTYYSNLTKAINSVKKEMPKFKVLIADLEK